MPAAAWETVLASFETQKPTAFRVNTLKATAGEVAKELRREGYSLSPVDWLAEAFTVPPDQRRALTETAAVAEGRVYIQGLSSMTAPPVLGPQPGEAVLDLAAAPGGKTLQMAAMMHNRGTLSAVESVRRRFFRLKENLERHGATMVRTFLADGRSIGRKVPERFDRVLLDAPCSSEARFDRRDPATWRYWGLKKIGESARKQKGLLRSALPALKPGGLLLYCTCSFAPEENEAIIDGLLRQHGEAVEVLPVELPLSNSQPGLAAWDDRRFHPAVARSVRILPNHQMGGLYLCLLRKGGEG